MITNIVQRWREKRGSYRPAGEVIDTSKYEVVSLEEDAIAKSFVLAHHYSGSFPAARFRFGLYRSSELVGVAVFSHPCNDRALACFPGETLASTELGRFVLLDNVPGNGETWFLARCFEALKREGIVGVISFSDPMARARLDGVVVHGGHVGTIYQAHNATYLGRAHADTVLLLPDGRTLNRRSLAKLRSKDKGWRYVANIFESAGAPAYDGTSEWVERAIATTTRAVRHPGNHKYAWGLARAAKRALPESKPYPKAA